MTAARLGRGAAASQQRDALIQIESVRRRLGAGTGRYWVLHASPGASR